MPRALNALAWAALLLLSCASRSAPEPWESDLAREGCAWEARFGDGNADLDARHAACLQRLGSGRGWRAGAGSRPDDRAVCLGEAHAGVLRFRACMEASGWREGGEGRVPYERLQGDATAREAGLAVRSCAEGSFEGSRYGPFSVEYAGCLTRRGWRRGGLR